MSQTLDTIECAANRTASWTVTLLDSQDQPVYFLGTETLEASCWPGGDFASLFAPTVTWVAPVSNQTNQLTLTVSSFQTAPLEPGRYRIDIDLPDTGQDLYDCWLELTSTPGTAATPSVYCQYSGDDDGIDMVTLFPAIATFESAENATQYVSQRHHARAWLELILQRHYQWTGYRGLTTFGYPVSIYPAWASDGRSKQLQDWLDQDKLIVTSLTKEICVCRALGLALSTVFGTTDEASAYAKKGDYYLSRANELFKSYVGEIDLAVPPTGIPSFTINCSVCSSRF